MKEPVKPQENGEHPSWSYEDTPDNQRAISLAAEEVIGQHVPYKPSKRDLLKAHELNLDVLKEAPALREIKRIILPNAYPPSSIPLIDLERISLSELRLETHHTGKLLVLRTITDPYVSSGINTLIEDEFENVRKLAVYNQDDALREYVLPKDSVVAIKEPYYKFNGQDDCVVRVDHPSDLHVLVGLESIVPSQFKESLNGKQPSTKQWKAAGDKKFLAKDYLATISCYTQALLKSPPTDKAFKSDLYRRRANLNFTIRRFDSAKSDALASISDQSGSSTEQSNQLNGRAYHTAGRASYELGNYNSASTYFSSALELSPNDPSYLRDQSRAQARLQEESHGSFDFAALAKTVTLYSNQLDAATYTTPTVVRETERHGRGLYTTRDIQPGELLMVEKAYHVPLTYAQNANNDDVIFSVNSGDGLACTGALLLSGLITLCYNNPSLSSTLLSMYSGTYPRTNLEGSILDNVPIVDIFLIEKIRQLNSFTSPLLSIVPLDPTAQVTWQHTMSNGLWPYTALINHTCIPNSIRTFIGSHQIVRSSCFIRSGEEITSQYIRPDADLSTRQAALQPCWGFTCDCWLCTSELSSPEHMRSKRLELFNTLRDEVMKSQEFLGQGKAVSNVMVKRVERLTRQLTLLHESEIYSTLPTLALVHPTIWLTETFKSRGNWVKMLKYALLNLRSFGWLGREGGDVLALCERGEGVDGANGTDKNGINGDKNGTDKNGIEEDGKLNITSDRAMVNIEFVRSLKHAAEALTALGREKDAENCTKLSEACLGMMTVI